MLTLIPIEEPAAAASADPPVTVAMRAAIAVSPAGGWAVIGWTGATDAEARDQARILLDDETGGGCIRVVALAVPVPARVAQSWLAPSHD
jgi:hypothetical protein